MTRRHLLTTLGALPALLPGCRAIHRTTAHVFNPHASDGTGLYPGVAADAETFTTLASLQRHTEWVSRPASTVPELLGEADFLLVDGIIDPDGIGGQAYVAERDGDVVVAFRGSGGETRFETFQNIQADIGVGRAAPTELLADPGDARVHDGFYKNYLHFREAVHRRVTVASGRALYITGFSLGSALAAFCAFDLAHNLNLTPNVHMLGTPRTGNLAWRAIWEHQVKAGLRCTLEPDPVPKAPPPGGPVNGYYHVSNLLALDLGGRPVPFDRIEGRIIEPGKQEDPFKAHNRLRYASAIGIFATLFALNANIIGAPPEAEPLKLAADAELKSARRPDRRPEIAPFSPPDRPQ